ncbi:hypothetical protein B1L02_15040 [Pseudoalteromonas piscicida]|uniref:Uncharacterized protein n=1 Tax=Pseudoalteromonas piscicida TaxID=43662 RepID=A0AAD0REU3_PSEO7|nr:hypothetical protein B1L02_15040 [Pseudoalteromonas piscicida]AXR01092.1 hypothetical protein D0511_02700 [Pseudoalteromonas piscicida]
MWAHVHLAGFKSSPNKSAPTKDKPVWAHVHLAGFKSSPNKSAPTKDSSVWGMLTLQVLKARRINRLLPKVALCGAC